MNTWSQAVAALFLCIGCSAPALFSDLKIAEQHEHVGEFEQALDAYETAMTTCRSIRAKRRRRDTCALAFTGRAELLERLDRKAEAAKANEDIPLSLDGDPVPSARGLYRAGRLYLSLGKDKRGYTLLWRTVTDYPDIGFAADALKVLLRDGRQRSPTELYKALTSLVEPLADTDIADNILYSLADLAENEFKDPATALQHYDTIASRYKERALNDDSLWHGARLARQLGDAEGAVKRYQDLLDTREVAFGLGSYFSVWLDDSQLELGIVLRDDLGQRKRAIAAFRQLLRDYPASVLHDDALWQTALTWHELGNQPRTCKTLGQLYAKWPDSRYELKLAPVLRDKLNCQKL